MVYIVLPFLPISVNHAYFQKGNHRITTTKGKKFKLEVKTYIVRNCPEFLSFFKKDKPYTLVVNFNIDRDALECRTWPGKAESRYKKYDASNRLKLLEDCIVQACGHDDSQHMTVVVSKTAIPTGQQETTEVWAFDLEKEGCPFDDWIGMQPRH